MGGAVCELLCRLGVPELHIWDADTVAPHNLNNQIFLDKHIGMPKTDAIEEILKSINPNIEIIKHGFCEAKDKMSGYIFMCIDNIDVRRELCNTWRFNPKIKFIIDGRMRVTECSVYASDWSNPDEKIKFINSMDYTHEEVIKNTPVSACGMTLSVVMSPRVCGNLMVANTIKFINTKEYRRLIYTDIYNAFMDSYEAK